MIIIPSQLVDDLKKKKLFHPICAKVLINSLILKKFVDMPSNIFSK